MERPLASSLPLTPGVYLYKDARGVILYVGKARNLRRRILSYFREDVPPKTVAMLGHAVSLETLSTGTEKEALLLEASLIKKHRPRYNIVLRDDKQYVLFRIDKKNAYPRLEIVRPAKGRSDKDREGAAAEEDGRRSAERSVRYFGPFTSGLAARETWKSIHRAFPLRRCSERSFKNRVRPCLYHHLGQCLAPCTEEVPPALYADLVRRVELLLAGRSREVLDGLRKAMLEASEALDFERAAVLRDQLRAVERTVERQSVVLPGGGDMDVVGLAPTPEGLALGLLFVREGRLMDGRTFFWPGLELADAQEALWSFLTQFYGPLSAPPPRIVAPWLPAPAEDDEESPSADAGNEAVDREALAALEAALAESRGGPVRLHIPRNAAEARLVDMAVSNAREAALKRGEPPLSERLAAIFHWPAPLRRVECVDVSHTGGRSTRIGMVVFEDGQPLKSAYRTYAPESAPENAAGGSPDGTPENAPESPPENAPENPEIRAGDDYAALAWWMRRRLASGPPWADLVLIDGGRGQVNAVWQALMRELREGAPPESSLPASSLPASPLAASPLVESLESAPFLLAGIAKARDEAGHADRRAGNVSDRIFLPGRSNPLPFKPGSPELLFLQHVRDTAHHHVIGRHRRARAKAALSGELLRIPGVGLATARRLWGNFDSLEAMMAASPEDLAAIPGIGRRRAEALARRLRDLAQATRQND